MGPSSGSRSTSGNTSLDGMAERQSASTHTIAEAHRWWQFCARGCYDEKHRHALHFADARHPPGGPGPARGFALQCGAQAGRTAAQLHIRDHRTVHAFSRLGRELIHLPGLAWLREIRWPAASAVLDGEAVAGDGSQGIQAVFQARHRSGNLMAFTVFDLLTLEGRSLIAEPWTTRRELLEDLLHAPPRGVCLVPVT